MVKIKRKVEMNEKELIKHLVNHESTTICFSGISYDGAWVSIEPEIESKVHFEFKDVSANGKTFTVEVEEALTQDTVFPSLAVVRKQHFASGNSTVHVTKINNKSINSLIGKQPINSTFEYKEVYLMDDDKLGQCIWRDGKLVE